MPNITKSCEIDINFIHTEEVPINLETKEYSTEYSLFHFTSSQLDIELNLVESITSGNNQFTLTVWNPAVDKTLEIGDQVIIKMYWMDATENFSLHSGLIEDVKTEVDDVDLKMTVTGSLLVDYIFSTIKPSIISASKHSTLIRTMRDFEDAVKTVGVSQVIVLIPKFNFDTELSDFVSLGNKNVRTLILQIKDILEDEYNRTVKCKYRNSDKSIIYTFDDDSDQDITLVVHVLTSDDLFSFSESISDDNSTKTIQIKTTGLVGFTSTEIFNYNDVYYISDDVVHSYSISEGYLTEIYAHTAIVKSDEDESTTA